MSPRRGPRPASRRTGTSGCSTASRPASPARWALHNSPKASASPPFPTFAGVGAYPSALLVLYARVPILVGIVAGALVAAAIGYGLGTLCLRMRAIYLALATWAFAESLRLLVTVEYQITRGDLGLAAPFPFSTPRPTP